MYRVRWTYTTIYWSIVEIRQRIEGMLSVDDSSAAPQVLHTVTETGTAVYTAGATHSHGDMGPFEQTK